MDAHNKGSNLEEAEESFLLVYLIIFGTGLYFLWLRRDRNIYRGIPSVGFSSTLTSYLTAIQYSYNPTRLLQKGYNKFPNGIFRIPTFTRWIVVIAKPKFIEELRKAPEDELSAASAVEELLKLSYTLDSNLLEDSQLKSLLGTQLTRNLQSTIPVMQAELKDVTDHFVSHELDDWKYVDEVEFTTHICNRLINGILVGTSSCKEDGYLETTMAIANDFDKHVRRLGYFPKPLRSFYAFFFTPFGKIKRKVETILFEGLKERQEQLVKDGEPYPNDMITWFIDHDPNKPEMPLSELASHILMTNYLAVNPTAKVMRQAIQILSQNPDYASVLRAEVEGIVRCEGWTKSAIEKMHDIDSFLKETMRLNDNLYNTAFPCLTMARKALRPIVLSDGSIIPPGTLTFVGSQLLHTNESYYAPSPNTFNPYRFVASSTSTRSQPQTTSTPEPFSFLYPNSTPPVRNTRGSSSPALSTPSSSSSSSFPCPTFTFPPNSSFSSASSSYVVHTTTIQAPGSTLPATSPTFLAWGHGKHACPGRFFASALMKVVLAWLVLEFDWRVPPRVEVDPLELEEKGKKEEEEEVREICSEDEDEGRIGNKKVGEAREEEGERGGKEKGKGKEKEKKKVLWVELKRRERKAVSL